jgi:NitT/TauT family transport system substrate-binding protein
MAIPLVSALPRSVALSIIAGATLGASVPVGAQTESSVVRLGAMVADGFGVPYYGADRGIFQDNGIEPHITTMASGAMIVQGVLGGDLDVGLTNAVQLAAAVARGIPVQMLAPGSLYSQRDAGPQLGVSRLSAAKVPADLATATIALSSLADFNQLGLEVWLDRNGVSRTGIKLVEMKFSEMGPALQRGTVQAAVISEPFMTDAVQAGQVRPFADIYLAMSPEFALIVWFATKSWLQAKPKVALKLRSGIFATARWANSHVQESGLILANVAKMDPNDVAKMRRVYFATSNERRYVQVTLDLAARYGIVQRQVSFEEYSAFRGS